MRPIPTLIGDSSTSIKYKHSICKHKFEHKNLSTSKDGRDINIRFRRRQGFDILLFMLKSRPS